MQDIPLDNEASLAFNTVIIVKVSNVLYTSCDSIQHVLTAGFNMKLVHVEFLLLQFVDGTLIIRE